MTSQETYDYVVIKAENSFTKKKVTSYEHEISFRGGEKGKVWQKAIDAFDEIAGNSSNTDELEIIIAAISPYTSRSSVIHEQEFVKFWAITIDERTDMDATKESFMLS